jgi:hypothetical protein
MTGGRPTKEEVEARMQSRMDAMQAAWRLGHGQFVQERELEMPGEEVYRCSYCGRLLVLRKWKPVELLSGALRDKCPNAIEKEARWRKDGTG